MREYEMMIILSPNVDERNLSTNVQKLLQVVPNEGGELEQLLNVGRQITFVNVRRKDDHHLVFTHVYPPPLV